MIRLLILAAVAAGVAACSLHSIDAAYLRHPETGDEVTCGPYRGPPDAMEAYVGELRGCINDFRAQGYVRIGKPSS